MKKIIFFIIIIVVFITQTTLFIIPPIGALPKGKTLLILRLNKTNFIDSPDAMCIRNTGKLNLLCRGVALASVAEKSTILLRLPYSSFLYDLSITTQAKLMRG
jgi:hypothetical protein